MPRKRGPPHPSDRRLAGDGGPADAADARRGSDLVLGADRPRSAGRLIQTDPFTRTGFITIVDASGHEIFGSAPTDLTERAIVAEAIGLLAAGTRLISVEPYRRPDGEVMLGAFAFPRPFEWAVLVEKRQRDAYLAIETMLQSLGLWVIVGLAVAVAGAIALALRISRPILKIDRVANEVAKGNFQSRVEGVRTRDEIGDLARHMNGWWSG